MSVLQVGTIEPTLANTLAVKYQALQLPDDSSSDAFLAEHAASVTAIVSSGPPGVDADLMEALPSLGAIVHQGAGYETIDVDAAHRLGIGVSNTARDGVGFAQRRTRFAVAVSWCGEAELTARGARRQPDREPAD